MTLAEAPEISETDSANESDNFLRMFIFNFQFKVKVKVLLSNLNYHEAILMP